MKRKRFTEAQIVGILKEAEGGVPIKDLTRRHGVSEQTVYRWKREYGGMDISQLKELKQLREENRRLKEMVADLSLDNRILKDISSKKW